MRDYAQITRRVQAAQGPDTELTELGRVAGLPVYWLRTGTRQRPAVLLLGGTHGDEPAGVEACLATVEGDLAAWREQWCFEVVPCLNPVGYVRDTRHNAQDVDINWAYARADVPEVQIIRQLVRSRRYQFVLDFHEDWESPGYYLYELRRNAPAMGREVIATVRNVCPVNMSPEIEGLPASGGLVAPDADQEVNRRGAGIPLAMYFDHTDHLLTSETPTMLPLAIRVAAHRAALHAVLRGHSRRQ